jgi:hypothetical protein
MASDGWPKFMKTFDEWRERNGDGTKGGGLGKFFADWMQAGPGGNGNGWR